MEFIYVLASLLLLSAPTGAQDLSSYCPDAIRTAEHAIPYEAYRTFRTDYSLEYCVLTTTITDPNDGSTSTKNTPSALSQAVCPSAGGTWTHRTGWEDESGSGGLSTSQKYLYAVSTFALMEDKCTYMAMSDDRTLPQTPSTVRTVSLPSPRTSRRPPTQSTRFWLRALQTLRPSQRPSPLTTMQLALSRP